MKEGLFDSNLCRDLREVINRTNIFYKDKFQSKKFNFICAFMDRFDYAVDYLNNHESKFCSDIDFMTYLMQASIIRDGIHLCCDLLDLSKETTTKYFNKVDYGAENDDSFFEYFRSLVFAHPLKTSRSIPNKIHGEIQYSPYCLINHYDFENDKALIGVKVYSNRRDSFSLLITFEQLQEYMRYKYNMLKKIIGKFNSIILDMENEWKKKKVNREQSSINILKEVVTILEERYLEHDYIDDLIEYLKCDVSLEKNLPNVNIFRNKIKEIIPAICDAVDKYEIDEIEKICSDIIYLRPEGYPMMAYQLEKIYCYLNEKMDADAEWALTQAEAFSKGFARKWVIINPYKMSFNEVKLLTTVSCYLESMEQKKEVDD